MSKTPKEMPRNADGVTIPHDHDDIYERDFLIKGVPSHQIKDNRISTALFKSSSDPYKGSSADLEQLAGGRNYSSGKYLGAVKFTASIPREKRLSVGYDPIKDENVAHCQIWRSTATKIKNISGGEANHMRRNSVWHVQIEGVNIIKPSEEI